MATLQKIRNRGPLLVIVIGAALFAFIAGDAWKIIRPNQGVVNVGKINGETINALDYQTEVGKYTEVVKFSLGKTTLSDQENASVKDEVWNTMVRNNILKNQTDAIGLVVTNAEVQSVIEEGNDPLLAQTPFQNEQTGRFDVDYLKSFLANYHDLDRETIPAEYLNYYDNMFNFWIYVEKNLKMSLLYSKYLAFVENSFISNPIFQSNSFQTRAKRANVIIAAMPYSAIPDSAVVVSKADLKRAYNEKKELLYQYAESRDIEYLDVRIMPSEQDRADLLNEVTGYSDQLSGTTQDFASFIRLTESSIPYSQVPRTKLGFPSDIAQKLDSVEVGGVFGPFYSNYDDSYNAFKVISTIQAYDSIEFCQIQVAAQSEQEIERISDSIYNAIRAGANFQEIAARYSQQGLSEWIASSDYEGSVYSGNNALYLNTLNQMKKGDLKKLKAEGINVILNVTNVKNPVKKYNVAVIKREAFFSDKTSNDTYNKLSQYVAANNNLDDFINNAQANGLNLMSVPDFQSFSNSVGDIPSSKDALRWTFEANPGDISKIFEAGNNNDRLLVVGLKAIHKKGYRTLDEVSETLLPELVNQKKAEIIIDKFRNVSNIDQAASIEGVKTDTVKYVNFSNSAYISLTYSNEPAIGAAVYNLKREQMSTPVKGEGGVFLVQKISPDEFVDEFNSKSESERLNALAARNISSQLLQELFFKADVTDIRYKNF